MRAFPKLAPLVALHLASPAGVPMHAIANGWYAYSGGMRLSEEGRNGSPTPPSFVGKTDTERAAHYLRVDASEIPEGLSEEDFSIFAHSLRGRWKSEAAEARALFDSLPIAESEAS